MAGNATPINWAKRSAVIAGWAVALLVTLSLALAGVAVVLMTGQTGRDIVEDLLDGRQIAGYGELQVSGLSGNPLDRLTISRLTVSDADGVWLEASDIVFDWKPRSLIGRHVEIQTLSVQTAGMSRRPVVAEREGGGGGGIPRWQISVDDLSLDEFHVAEPVAGQDARLTAEGALARADGDWQADLSVSRLDGGADAVRLQALIGETIAIDASITAPPGGPLASLLRAADSGLSADLQIEGSTTRGEGGVEISAGGEPAVLAALHWGEGEARLEGEARPANWPGFELADRLLGGAAEFAARVALENGSLLEPDLSAPRAEIRSPRLELTLARSGPDGLAVDIAQASALVAELTNGAVQSERLSAQGVLTLTGDRRFEGEIAAEGLDLGLAAFERASGPLVLTGPLSRPQIETELTTRGASFDQDTLDRLLGATPSVAASMIYSRETGDLSFENLVITGEAGRVAGQGLLSAREGDFTFRVTGSELALSTFGAQLDGTLSAGGRLSGNWRGPINFDVEGQGRDLDGRLRQVLGDSAQIDAQGRWAGGREVFFERLHVDSPALQLDMTGDTGPEGFTARGEALFSGEIPVSTVALDGEAAIVFDARYLAGRLDARGQIETPQISAGPVTLSDGGLRVEAQGPLDALTGEWRLDGQMENGPVDLAGDFSRDGERLSLPGIDGRFGPFAVNGSASAGPASMRFDLTASPVAGFGQFDTAGSLEQGVLDVTLSAQDLVQGDMVYLDSLEATATGPLEDVDLRFDADGAYGARFSATAHGTMRLAGGPLRVRLSPEGQYGDVPVRTIEPVVVERGEAGLRIDGALGVGEGRVQLSYQPVQGVPVLQAGFTRLPARLLSYRRARAPMAGTFSGEADLRFAPDGWTGSARISGEGLQPREDEDGLAIDVQLSAGLDRQGLSLELSGQAPELDLNAGLDLATGPVTGFGDLTAAQTGLEGELRIDGQIAPVAAFQLPAGRVLRGEVDAGAQIAGTVGSPVFRGQAALDDGAFADRQAGLEIRGLSARAVFQNDGLTISSIEGRGAEGGTLTGQGRLSLAGAQMSGEARLQFEDLTLVSRPDLTAVGDGEVDITLEDRTIGVSGETRLDQVEARPPGGGQEPITTIEVTEINVAGEGETGAEIVPSPRQAFDVELDYHIVADNQVFVRGQAFDTEWSLDVQVTGSPSDIRLDGEANLIRGNASMLGQRFVFDRGTVTLDGPPRDARLDVVAVREAREITAQVRVTGTARSPRIALSSTPSLPDDEIASRLLFGQGRGDLSGVQAAQLAASLAGAAGGFDPFSALRGLTGLDQLSIISGDEGGTIVSGGRYLTDDVYLQLTSAAGGAAPTTRIEWQLTRRFTLESELGASGQAGLSLSWRRDYDRLSDLDWF